MSKEFAEKNKNKKTPQEIKAEAQAKANVNSNPAPTKSAPKPTQNTTVVKPSQKKAEQVSAQISAQTSSKSETKATPGVSLSGVKDKAKDYGKQFVEGVKKYATTSKAEKGQESTREKWAREAEEEQYKKSHPIKSIWEDATSGKSAKEVWQDVNPAIKTAGAVALPFLGGLGGAAISAMGLAKTFKDENNREVEIPTLESNDDVIDYYESLPDDNIVKRLVSQESRDNYRAKQQLSERYQEAKDETMPQLLEDAGVSRKMQGVMATANKVINPFGKGMTLAPANYLSQKQYLMEQGLSETDADYAIQYMNRNLDNAINNALVEKSGESTLGKIAGSEASVLARAVGSPEDVAEKAIAYVTGKAMTKDGGRGARVMNLSRDWREKASENMSGVGKFLYGTGMSFLDMMAAVGLAVATGGGSTVSSALMSLEKASDVMDEGIRNGYNPDQIMGTGIASAITTFITEKLSLGKLDEISEKSLDGLVGSEFTREFVKKVAASFATEGSQEVAEGIADTIVDYLIAGDKSAIPRAIREYEETGKYSKKEATLKAIGDYAIQTVMDLVGGGLMGMGYSGARGVNNLINTRSALNSMSGEDYNALVESDVNELAESLGADEEANAEIPALEQAIAEQSNGITDEELQGIENVLAEEEITNPDVNNIVPEEQNAVNMANPETELFTDENVNESGDEIASLVESELAQNPESESGLLPEWEDYLATLESGENTDTTSMPTEMTVDTSQTQQTVNESTTERPTAIGGEEYTTRGITNTLRNSKIFRGIESRLKWLEDTIDKGHFKTQKVSEQESMNAAVNAIAQNGIDNEANRIENTPDASGVDFDESMLISEQMMNEAEQTGDYSRLTRFLETVFGKQSEAARALQAMVKYTRTAVGTLGKTMAMINVKNRNASAKVTKGANQALGKLNRAVSLVNNPNANDNIASLNNNSQNFAQIRQTVEETVKNDKSGIFDNYTDNDITYLANLIQRGAKGQDLANRLIQKHETGFFEISPEDITRVNQIFQQIDSLKNKESKTAYDLEMEAYGIMAKYLGNGSAMEKWNAWRYLAMLGNPRTHIRNMVGNGMFGAVTNYKDNVAGILESILIGKNRFGQERRRAFVTKLSAKDRAKVKAAKVDFDEHAYAEAKNDGNKYDMNRDIERQRKIYKDKGIGKALNWLVDKNGKALDSEDVFAIKNKYARVLAGYLKANHLDMSILESENPQDMEKAQKARKFALEQAKIATFHEESGFASFLNQMSKKALNKESSLGTKALGYAIESAVPFKGTPVNILKQGALEYNPFIQAGKTAFESGRSIVQIVKSIAKKNDSDAKLTALSDAINSFAQGATGAEVMALGAWLFSRGILRAGGKDDEDWAQKEQEYSLNFGNHSYTIDWAAPAALPLFMGAELKKWWDDSNAGVGDFFNAITRVGNPVLELSMLQGIQDALENFSKASTRGDKLMAGLAGFGVGYLSQAIPTALGQVARTVDPYRRDTYTGEEKGTAADVVRKQIEKNVNKIPFLSMYNEPYRDTLGNAEKNQDLGMGALGRGILNMLSPGYYSETHTNWVYNELSDIRDELESEGIEVEAGYLFPSPPQRTYNGERLSPEEFDEAQKLHGQITKDNLKELFDTDAYANSTAEEAAELINEMNKFSNRLYLDEMFGESIESGKYKKYLDIYDEQGMDGLADYIVDNIQYQGALDDVGLDASSKTREIYNNLGEDGLDDYADAYAQAEELGADSLTASEWEYYRKGDMDSFNNAVSSRVTLEENGLDVNSATQKYITEHGDSGIKDLKKAEKIVSTIPKGKDRYGNTVYRNLDSSMMEILESDGLDGLKQYKDAIDVASKYGVDNLTTDEWKTYRNGDYESFNDLVKYRQILESNDLTNNEFNRSFVKKYGEESIPVLQEASEAITQIQKGVDKYGDAQYFSPNEKLVGIYQDKGKEGVETFADIYMKNDIDGDPSNRTLKDTVPYIHSLDMTDYEKGYYLYQFLSSNNRTKKYVENRRQPDYASLYREYINDKKYRDLVRNYNG